MGTWPSGFRSSLYLLGVSKTALSPQDEFSGRSVRRVNGSFPDLNMQTEILLSG